ncbi:hypothetical protein QYM36_014664 [Artemia franciscana]|uniref:Uncharacterized protein n=1 Tax=Artemia franciscana TaxID=6661 RepID=A0AA88HJU5_ARTSF|nr:hypothetical protein QYM36_014664 [Artemia franciscana]
MSLVNFVIPEYCKTGSLKFSKNEKKAKDLYFVPHSRSRKYNDFPTSNVCESKTCKNPKTSNIREESENSSLLFSPHHIHVLIVHEDSVDEEIYQVENTTTLANIKEKTNEKIPKPIMLLRNITQIYIDVPEIPKKWSTALKALGLSATTTAAITTALTWPAAPLLFSGLGRKKRSLTESDYDALCKEVIEKILNMLEEKDHLKEKPSNRLQKRIIKVKRKKGEKGSTLKKAQNEELYNSAEIQNLVRNLIENLGPPELFSVFNSRPKKAYKPKNPFLKKSTYDEVPEKIPNVYTDLSIQGRTPMKNQASFHVLPVSQNEDSKIVADFVENTFNRFKDSDQKIQDKVFSLNQSSFVNSNYQNKVPGQRIKSTTIITQSNEESPSDRIKVVTMSPGIVKSSKATDSPVTYFKVKPFITPTNLNEDLIKMFLDQISVLSDTEASPGSDELQRVLSILETREKSFSEPRTLPPTSPATRLETKSTRVSIPEFLYINPTEVPSTFRNPPYKRTSPKNNRPNNYGPSSLVTITASKNARIPVEVTVTSFPVFTKTPLRPASGLSQKQNIQDKFKNNVQPIYISKPSSFSSVRYSTIGSVPDDEYYEDNDSEYEFDEPVQSVDIPSNLNNDKRYTNIITSTTPFTTSVKPSMAYINNIPVTVDSVSVLNDLRDVAKDTTNTEPTIYYSQLKKIFTGENNAKLSTTKFNRDKNKDEGGITNIFSPFFANPTPSLLQSILNKTPATTTQSSHYESLKNLPKLKNISSLSNAVTDVYDYPGLSGFSDEYADPVVDMPALSYLEQQDFTTEVNKLKDSTEVGFGSKGISSLLANSSDSIVVEALQGAINNPATSNRPSQKNNTRLGVLSNPTKNFAPNPLGNGIASLSASTTNTDSTTGFTYNIGWSVAVFLFSAAVYIGATFLPFAFAVGRKKRSVAYDKNKGLSLIPVVEYMLSYKELYGNNFARLQ